MRRIGRRLTRFLILIILIILTYNLLMINPDKRNNILNLKRNDENINNSNNKNSNENDYNFPKEQNEVIHDYNKDKQQLFEDSIIIPPQSSNNKFQSSNQPVISNQFQKNQQFNNFPIHQSSRLGNYEPKEILTRNRRTGPGEYGEEVKLPEDDHTKQKVQSTISEYGFNIIASEMVSMDRAPADLRHEECKRWDYPEIQELVNNDVSVAVILVFHNEAFSTLMRTVHNIFNYSPEELLKEVVLIDDGSNKQDLKQRLDDYVKLPRWNSKIKLFRNLERHGLIRARCDGARKATASILVYLDAHCEAGPNWLLPLVMPIVKNPKACTCPLVDVIDGNKYTFVPQAGGDSDGFARGAWDWDLLWKRVPLTHREKNKRIYTTEPYASPAMAGGLFAINKNWFFELGLYDEELEIWGGENFEISYKLWMCGGSLLFVPCSRVGHIYRLPGWRGNPPQKSVHANFAMRNYRRVIDVWWDDYAKYFYERRPEAKNVDPGDLSKPRSLREKLQCKNFDWFMKEIAYDIPLRYPIIVPDNGAEGKLSLIHNKNYCLNAKGGNQGSPISLSKCDMYGDITAMLTWHEDIRFGKNKNDINERKQCLDCTGLNREVTIWECHGQGGNQLFKYHPKEFKLVHAISGGCVTGDVSGGKIFIKRCDSFDDNQKWGWENVNYEQIEKFNQDPMKAVIVKEIDDI